MVLWEPNSDAKRVLAGGPRAMSFLVSVSKASSRLSDGDTLVIVLVGHGDDQSHTFVVGNEKQHFELKKEVLEHFVHGSKGNILVINPACLLVAGRVCTGRF